MAYTSPTDRLPDPMKKPVETQAPAIKDDETLDASPAYDESAAQDTADQADAEQARKMENDATLAGLGQVLASKFDENARKRMYIEDRWLEDLRQYHGRYDPSIETDLQEAESCALFLNITRPKTNAYAARVIDMVLPTDEKNWGMEETPVSELVQAAVQGINDEKQAMQTPDQTGAPQAPGSRRDASRWDAARGRPTNPDGTLAASPVPMTTPEGAPVLQKDIVKGIKDEAHSRAEMMEEEIDDQLQESRYNAIQRKAIDQMSKLGTSVLLGPVILDEWLVKWLPQPQRDPNTGVPTGKTDYIRTLVPNSDKRAGVQWIDVWNFYPDMTGTELGGLEHSFVQYLVNKAEFRKYAKRFNFMPEALERAMAGGTMNMMTIRWMQELRNLSETQNFVDNRYQLLRYFGEISEEDLLAVGKDPASLGLDGKIIWGQVWICNKIVLKVDLNPLDSGELPLSISYCDKDEASIFGVGIPRMMRGEQESVNSAWRMMHDNGGLSVGPQTIMKVSAVTPADGDYHMKPKKLWYANDDTVDVRAVFQQFTIDSHQTELQNILQLGIRFADDVTQLPLLMQGDQAPHITQTAQGMSLLYNASTVVLRRTVKLYDDYVTEPMIGRFFEWNMQFNPRDDIKGDMRCVARGSSTLLDKEQQGQALDTMMQIAMQPTWQPYIDMEKLLRLALKAKRIEDIILPEDEIKSNLKAQQEAAAAAAQAGQKPAPAADPLAQAKIDAMNKATDAKLQDIQSRERAAIAKIAAYKEVSLQEATAMFAGIKLREDGTNQRFNAETQVKQQMGSGI